MNISDEEKEERANIINKSYQGIIPYHEVFYINSIIYSSERCLDAFSRYEFFLRQNTSADTLLSILQEAVGHAAALSRFFWPSLQGKKNEKSQINMRKLRGEKLRQSFLLNESSELFKRDLRNTFEHFDEKIDSYFLEDNFGTFYPECIIAKHELADEPSSHIFKLIDPDTECLVLLGKKFFFSGIRLEVKRIYDLGVQFYTKDGRLKFEF